MAQDTKPNTVMSTIHKQIFEIKKKIQLSEGQRKAAFEDSESERKSNADEILALKKDISQLLIQLKETRKSTATLSSAKIKHIESIVGPIEEKSLDQVYETLDLQKTDKTKAVDLIQYEIKKRQKLLTQLGEEYKLLLSQKAQKEMLMKVDRPVKKSIRELQNSIHAVEVQSREANHIGLRYNDILRTLQEDSAKFESKIRKIEAELTNQRGDITRLQQVLDEATKIRATVRSHLLHEERAAMSSANQRDKQTNEGKRLVAGRKRELEFLEKRIFQGGKSPMRTEHDDNPDDGAVGTDDEAPETSSQEDFLTEAFEALKTATGATSGEEVLGRFVAQQETQQKLLLLRKKYETEKKHLERKLEVLNTKLEQFKYAEVKELERKTFEMETIQESIKAEQKRSQDAENAQSTIEKSIRIIASEVQELHFCVDPLTVPEENVLNVLVKIKLELGNILRKIASKEEETQKDLQVKISHLGVSAEEKWLPAPYGGLVRKTPLPQQGSSPAPPPPPGSEDEEEVPSRAYLKRQAQLVVDAKSRRKNVRMQAMKK